MNLIEEVKIELEKIKTTKFNESNSLTNNTYFLGNDILMLENKLGDARFPIIRDGLGLFVHQNGNISLSESNFFLINESLDGEINYSGFFLGVKDSKNNNYSPYSLFEINKNSLEKPCKRYTIFKNSHALYILETEKVTYCLRISLNYEQELIYQLALINNSNEEVEVYSSMYFNFCLMHQNRDSIETKWFKESRYENGVFKLKTVEDLSRYEHLYHSYNLLRSISNDDVQIENTTSRRVYSGSKSLKFESSECLINGTFNENKLITRFSDNAICGDLIKIKLAKKEEVLISYKFTKNLEIKKISNDKINEEFDEIIQKTHLYYENPDFLRMNFSDSDRINGELFTKFINRVIHQVDYCGRTKNSTLTMLGIRDIFQAIEATLMWNQKEARDKILETLSYTNINGRLPRQYGKRIDGKNFAPIDAREFIDSGLWVIDTIHYYLSFTEDYDILKEKCDYIEIKGSTAYFQNKKDSVLKHLYTIMDYLVNNIDPKTHCLKILYGDWNDAVDGLGKGKDYEGFGDGVSIMATFQLYNALKKIIDIIEHFDNSNHDKLNLYKNNLKIVTEGLKKNAFVKKNGEVKILHGWGKDRSFYVGSFNDVDKKERDSLTSNAFYVISNFYKEDNQYIETMLKAYKRLDSKYGYKTFIPGFEGDAIDVGRIVNLPIGTAENGAVYIHGTVFAIDSLFLLDRADEAWNQVFKIIPITHNFVSTTPFIMPNSYIESKDIDVDGESMNDWFTGSSSTLIKALVRDAFGVYVDLDYLYINPVSYFPFKTAVLEIKPCKTKLFLKYFSGNNGKRSIKINGKEVEPISLNSYKKAGYKISKKDLENSEKLEIEIID